jgi:urea transport system permease protein
VGGRATLYGAVIGAVAVNYGKSYFTGAFPEAWLFALGGLFVFVTLFLPQGIAGLFRRLKRRRSAAEAAGGQEVGA